MNRLSAAPVLVAALLLLIAAAAAMGWVWLRAGRPDHVSMSNVVVLLAPLALVSIAVLVWGAGDERLAIAVWVAFMLGAAFPAIHALHVGAASAHAERAIPAAESANDLPTALERYGRLFDGTLNDLVLRDMGQWSTCAPPCSTAAAGSCARCRRRAGWVRPAIVPCSGSAGVAGRVSWRVAVRAMGRRSRLSPATVRGPDAPLDS